MAMTLAELRELKDRLVRLRSSGERTVSYEGFSATYASDGEMRAAIADISRQIAELTGDRPVTQIRIRSTKGL